MNQWLRSKQTTMFKFITFCCLITIFILLSCQATDVLPTKDTTAQTPKPTKEPSEHVSFRIIYESHIHKIIVVKGTECYVFSLSDAERTAVHTDAGMRAIELKLLSAIGTDAVTETTREELQHRALHTCGTHAKTFYVEKSA